MKIEKFKHFITKFMKMPADFEIENYTINIRMLSCESDKISGILLDCGCGAGESIIEIEKQAPMFKKLIGIDINYTVISKVCNKISDKVIFICADCLNIPLRDSSVDVVLSNQVIEHISQYERYIGEIVRILKPSGLFVISTPNVHCPRNVALKLSGQKPILRWSNINNLPDGEFRGHVQEFREDQLKEIVEKYGFMLLKNCSIIPRPTLRGNLLFKVYSILEYIFFIISRPFVQKGYSKNINMLFRIRK